MDVPLLLAAVSATSPCGEDMEYDAQFLQLERDAKGQPERSMGDAILPAEPPEWRSIQQQSLDLLQRSKDLRITHFLLQSALALQGVAGLADALTLINALLREYWADLHPRLDADDDNDPTVRINALSGLTGDATIRLLRESILTRSRTFGAVSLRAALNASGLMSFPDEQLGAQQLKALAEGRECLVQIGRVIVGAFPGYRFQGQVEQRVGRDQAGLGLGTIQGGLQTGL